MGEDEIKKRRERPTFLLTRFGLQEWQRLRCVHRGPTSVWHENARERIGARIGIADPTLGASTLERIICGVPVDLVSIQKVFAAVDIDPANLVMGIHYVPRSPKSERGPDDGTPANFCPTVGRAREIAELAWLVRQYPLVEMFGPPGIGKTHVAHELAARLNCPVGKSNSFQVQVYECGDFADSPGGGLSARSESRLIAAIRLSSQSTHCGAPIFLIVVDGCERVSLGACRTMSELSKLVGGRMLLVSREPIGLGESLELGPLGLPPPDLTPHRVNRRSDDSTNLFLQEYRRQYGVRPGMIELSLELIQTIIACRGVPQRLIEAARDALRGVREGPTPPAVFGSEERAAEHRLGASVYASIALTTTRPPIFRDMFNAPL